MILQPSANCALTVPAPILPGVNLSDDATCGPASANLLVVADAMIGPLADNGRQGSLLGTAGTSVAFEHRAATLVGYPEDKGNPE